MLAAMLNRRWGFSGLFAFLSIVACATSERDGFTDSPAPTIPEDGIGGGFDSEAGAPPTATSNFNECASGKAALARVPLYTHFIVDGSASMVGKKWTAFTAAFRKFIDELAYENDPMIGVGLFIFDGSKGVLDFAFDDVPIRAVDSRHATLLKDRVGSVSLIGGTPLEMALKGQLPLLRDYKPYGAVLPNGRRVAVLVSDGVPNAPDADLLLAAKNRCIDLVKGARVDTPPVTFFAIGVGDPKAEVSDYDEVFLGDLAIAGGEAAVGCTPGWNENSSPTEISCHFQITPGEKIADDLRDEFLAMMRRIQNLGTCSLEIGAPTNGQVIDPGAVNVIMVDEKGKETTVLQDPKDGWTYDDPSAPTRVNLHGASCNSAQHLVGGEVRVTLGCKTLVK